MPIDFRTFARGAGNDRWNVALLTWPKWARAVLVVPMVPGLLLLVLSLLLLLVSIVALFVLTAPVYTLLNRMLSERKSENAYRSPGSKRVEAVIRDV